MTAALQTLTALASALPRPIRIMEVCGTHTMASFRCGLRSVLPPSVSLLSGPGCPVCVTPHAYLDHAICIARQPGVLVTTFGDMLRVPGRTSSLEVERAAGARVRVVSSPLDALEIARAAPDTQVVFLGIGFETTAPATAWAIRDAHAHVPNFSVLCAHKVMPPAMDALLAGGDVGIDGFLCPGHVSVIIGSDAYRPLVDKWHIPSVVAGFEPADIVASLVLLVRQILDGRAEVEVEYTRSVSPAGNPHARAAMADAFRPCDAEWRGLGVLPGSGLSVAPRFAKQDAASRFPAPPGTGTTPQTSCRCGDVLRGVLSPPGCPLFRTACTPAHPLGPCMVSTEGTCAAHFHYA